MVDSLLPDFHRLDDPLLKAAYQLSNPTSDAHHLTESEWEGLAAGDFDLKERDRLLSHIMVCAECSLVHRSVLQLTEIQDSHASVVRRPRWAFWAPAASLAAAMAIVAAVVLYRPVAPLTDEVTRSADTTVIEVVTPPSGSPLSGRHFAWTRVRGADLYELRLNRADGQLVWLARGAESDVTVPPDIALPSGPLFFQITAFREGIRIGSSRLQDVRVD